MCQWEEAVSPRLQGHEVRMLKIGNQSRKVGFNPLRFAGEFCSAKINRFFFFSFQNCKSFMLKASEVKRRISAHLNKIPFFCVIFLFLLAASLRGHTSCRIHSNCVVKPLKSKHFLCFTLSLSHMHPYRGWPVPVLQVFGLSGHLEKQAHLKWSAGVPCSSLEAPATTLRNRMQMDRTIVVCVLSVLWKTFRCMDWFFTDKCKCCMYVVCRWFQNACRTPIRWPHKLHSV